MVKSVDKKNFRFLKIVVLSYFTCKNAIKLIKGNTVKYLYMACQLFKIV